MRDGKKFSQEDGILYPVLVDDLRGTTRQVYGGLADPTYLIDRDGRVAFYNMRTHAPTLHEAIEELIEQNGRGAVKGGTDRVPHLLASMTDGWKGLRRGMPQSFTDLETSMPGAASGPWLGYQLRPLLAPLALRGEPLPVPVKFGLALGAGVVVALGINALRRRGGEQRRLKTKND